MSKKGAGLKGSNKDDGPAWEDDAVHKSYSWSGAITNYLLWQPASGRRFIVTDFWLVCTTATLITVFDNEDANNKHLVAGSFAANGGISASNLRTPFRSQGVDRNLNLTTNGGSGYIVVMGYEE